MSSTAELQKGVIKEEKTEIVVKVKRFSKERGEWWQEYKLAVDRFTQITEVLRRIRSEQDPSLSYRAACHMAVCGSCAMKINGAPRLACKTLALDLVKRYNDNVITLEPMDRFPVVKDLITDMTEFYDKMYSVKPRLYPSPQVLEDKAQHRLRPEDQRLLWKYAQCIWCGLCVSSCPAVRIDEKFLGPAAHAKGFRFLADPRDTIQEERMKILLDSAWRCTYCYMCFEVCPREIEPVEAIKLTRTYTPPEGMSEVSRMGEKHTDAIKESITKSGKLMEAYVYGKAYGAGAIRDFVYFLASGRGKYLLVREKPVNNISEVKKLMGEAK
ncbi:succinate dehydrogenase [Sulfolobales archaeon HS-7]|nr:succinate dehydrogenase [Sulfolobales archaeon HS-7]